MKLPDEVDYRYARTLLADVQFWRNLAFLLPYAVSTRPLIRIPHQRRAPVDIVPTPRLTPRPRYH